MGIDLMSGIPNEPVMRKVEDAVQGDGKFNDTEIGGKVNGAMIVELAEFVPDFGGELVEFFP